MGLQARSNVYSFLTAKKPPKLAAFLFGGLMGKHIISIILLFLATGCSSVEQKLDPKVFYKRDMQIKVNGHVGEGVLVVPKSNSYKFDIESKGKLDLFTFSTCHREQTGEKMGKKGWFADKRRRKFTYKPTAIESESLACPVQLGGFERKRGRHSWAFIDFEHESLNLPALVSCNGSVYNSRGLTACQSRAGLIQEIKFAQPVIVAEKNACIILSAKDKMTFRFKMPKGRCIFRFVNKAGPEKWHRMTTIGYEAILIREN